MANTSVPSSTTAGLDSAESRDPAPLALPQVEADPVRDDAPVARQGLWARLLRKSAATAAPPVPAEPFFNEPVVDTSDASQSTVDTQEIQDVEPLPKKRPWYVFGQAKKRPDIPQGSAATVAPRFSLKRKVGLGGTAEFTALPLRVLMGYFPDITERDAREYAQGIAEKYFDQPGIVFFGAYAYDTGYIYEVHEGGAGRSYTPDILKYFNSQGPFKAGEDLTVVIDTASRRMEVRRLRNGVSAVLLPESSLTTATPWLRGTSALTPALNTRSAFFKSAVWVFATGVLAVLATGLFFRLQPYDLTKQPKVISISTDVLPRTQWQALTSVSPGAYVTAIRYRNGGWEPPELQGQPAATAPAPTALAAPLVAPDLPGANAPVSPSPLPAQPGTEGPL